MNNFIQIGEKGSSYVSFTFSSKGDLIMETSIYNNTSKEDKKYFYGIQKNGRGLIFNSKTNNYCYQKNFNNEVNISSSDGYYKLNHLRYFLIFHLIIFKKFKNIYFFKFIYSLKSIKK